MNWTTAITDLAAKVAGSALDAHPAPAVAPVLKVGKLSLTGADVRALYDVASHLITWTASVKDAETVADTVIDSALSVLAPGVAFIAAPAADALANLIIEGIASGRIKGAADPIREGQTKPNTPTGRWIGR